MQTLTIAANGNTKGATLTGRQINTDNIIDAIRTYSDGEARESFTPRMLTILAEDILSGDHSRRVSYELEDLNLHVAAA